jgi:hypothetical protein
MFFRLTIPFTYDQKQYDIKTEFKEGTQIQITSKLNILKPEFSCFEI